jgi:histidyl-tRNA synthetase
MEAIGLGGESNAGRRLTVMRAIDKLDRLGVEGVRLLLGAGRKDESGDFTKGAGLAEADIDALLEFLQPKFPQDILVTRDGRRIHERSEEASTLTDADIDHMEGSNASTIASLRHLFDCPKYLDGLAELEELANLTEMRFPQSAICIDPSVVRGLEYYTGPVFEAELTFEVKDDEGRPVRFGSVGGGGRYDGLVARFREEPVPATGFSIGVSRLLAALRAIKSPIVAAAETPGPVVVLALDRDAASMANYQRLVASLRQAGVAAELYLGSGGMNAQLKYADRRRSRVAVIQGSNERNAAGGPQVTIRDLNLGAELAKTTKDRADYLELRQRAQFSAPEAELVERVREVLARR